MADGSKKPSRIKGKQWNDTMVEMPVNVADEDMKTCQSPSMTPNEMQEHLAFMTANAKGKTEVVLRNLTTEERQQFEAAKDKEVDRWISNSVFKVVRRAGIPLKRIMAMRWNLTWKEAPEDTKAKARLVAKGFADPGLLTIRGEAPTLSKIGRHCLLQLACSHKFKIEMGDVSTAFLQGDKEEQNRDVYLEPTADLRQRLNIGKESVLKLTGSVYGLRNAPRSWFKRVKKDLEALGWRCHQVDPMHFLKYGGEELVGICGVCADDFIIAGNKNGK